ncbi:hypothetical protein MMC20_008141 [Loxospora ochrophaea]|nr:hypothetical protein [Loxospora ochrophaea]
MLSHILEVNTKSRTALVEPNVPMDRLVATTMKYGLVPPVVMEFPGITVGGGYAGTSAESSSFKHGFFNCTINYVEMILANGDIVTASDSVRPDLFHGAAGAVGSLGVTALVEIRLIEAKPYVEMSYFPIKSIAEGVEKIEKLTAENAIDYVDGILFSKEEGAIIAGHLVNDVPKDLPIRRFTRARDPWFYRHVHKIIRRSRSPSVEYIPLGEYLFRYDRGGFWVGASAFKYFMMPFNRFTRWFLDDFLHTRMLYRALHASGYSRQFVIQDLALPYPSAERFVEYVQSASGIYPLWLCPLRQSPQPTFHPHLSGEDVSEKAQKPMLNIGVWGPGPAQRNAFIALNRQLESKLRDLGGTKWLYAHTYYTEEEFWSIYDRNWYDRLRAKYGATSLPSVFDKVHIDVEAQRKAPKPSWGSWFLTVWPFTGLWGIWKAIESGDYMLARNSSWTPLHDKYREKVD